MIKHKTVPMPTLEEFAKQNMLTILVTRYTSPDADGDRIKAEIPGWKIVHQHPMAPGGTFKEPCGTRMCQREEDALIFLGDRIQDQLITSGRRSLRVPYLRRDK